MRSLSGPIPLLVTLFPAKGKPLNVSIDTGKSANGIFTEHEELTFRMKRVNPSAKSIKVNIASHSKNQSSIELVFLKKLLT